MIDPFIFHPDRSERGDAFQFWGSFPPWRGPLLWAKVVIRIPCVWLTIDVCQVMHVSDLPHIHHTGVTSA